MKITAEMSARIREMCEDLRTEYEYVGIRFETALRDIDDVCSDSKHNPDRDDERDFPEFGTDEYDDLPDLDGTSCWDYRFANLADTTYFDDLHCYIVVGGNKGCHDNPDDGEILIKDAKVAAIIF